MKRVINETVELNKRINGLSAFRESYVLDIPIKKIALPVARKKNFSRDNKNMETIKLRVVKTYNELLARLYLL